MLKDVDNAVRYISKQKGVDASRIAIVGSSYGSSQAIMYASDHNAVKAVALLSPGLNYFSTMATGPAAEKYGTRPLFAIASEEDKESVEAVNAFKKLKGDAPRNYFKIYPGKAHGTDIFKADAKLEPALLVFLKKNL
jgi:dienelactone hydrolase